MIKTIPGYSNYQFNTETLQVISLPRIARTGFGFRTIKEKILKPSLDPDGYYVFGFRKGKKMKIFKRSQISWLVEHNSLPIKGFEIDHINNDKTCDYIWNLQLLSHRNNIAKLHQQNGKELPTGVSQNKHGGKYYVRIRIEGRTKYLGSYRNISEASRVYENKLREVVRVV